MWPLCCFASASCLGKHSIVMLIDLQNAIPLMHVVHQLYIHYCINWKWSVPGQTVEGGIPLTLMVPAHLSIPLITGRGTGTVTCWIGGVFPPDDLWIGLDIYMNCILIYDWFWKPDWLGVPIVLFVMTDGERDSLWWPAFSGHWLSSDGCYQYLLDMRCLMYGLMFLRLSTSLGSFHPRTFFGLDSLDWTGSHGPLYIRFTYYIQYNQRECCVSGLATDSPCGVLGRGWTTCLLGDGPILGSCF